MRNLTIQLAVFILLAVPSVACFAAFKGEVLPAARFRHTTYKSGKLYICATLNEDNMGTLDCIDASKVLGAKSESSEEEEESSTYNPHTQHKL